MESSGGWQFWLDDNGSVRQFMVAEPDEIKARQYLRKRQLTGKILSRKMVPEDIIQIVKMKPCDVCEWVAATIQGEFFLLQRPLSITVLGVIVLDLCKWQPRGPSSRASGR